MDKEPDTESPGQIPQISGAQCSGRKARRLGPESATGRDGSGWSQRGGIVPDVWSSTIRAGRRRCPGSLLSDRQRLADRLLQSCAGSIGRYPNDLALQHQERHQRARALQESRISRLFDLASSARALILYQRLLRSVLGSITSAQHAAEPAYPDGIQLQPL